MDHHPKRIEKEVKERGYLYEGARSDEARAVTRECCYKVDLHTHTSGLGVVQGEAFRAVTDKGALRVHAEPPTLTYGGEYVALIHIYNTLHKVTVPKIGLVPPTGMAVEKVVTYIQCNGIYNVSRLL